MRITRFWLVIVFCLMACFVWALTGSHKAVAQGKAAANVGMSVPDPDVARVIFAEAGKSEQSCRIVASVIVGRLEHPGFGKLHSMHAVVRQPHAFSCIGDKHNRLWAMSANPDALTGKLKAKWEYCVKLSSGDFDAIKGRDDRPLVYYHDYRIAEPKSWNNHRWRTVLEIKDANFYVYSVIKQ